MSEKYKASPESNRPNSEQATERSVELPEVNEKRENENKAKSLETARQQIEHLDTNKTADQLKTHDKSSESSQQPYIATSKRQTYRQTMSEVRKQLPRRQALLSRLVHAPILEVSGDFVAKTLFRPLPVLMAGVFASVVTLAVYIIARRWGYEISGSGWFMASLLAGFAFGSLVDFFRLVVLRKKHSS